MPRYYEENALIEFVKQSVPHINGETTLKCVERAIHNAPTADVVPKSEVEKLVQDRTRLVQENETLKDNNEHLAVMLEEKEIELKAMRGVANSYKMHYAKAMEGHEEVYRLASEIKAELPLAYAEIAKNVASEIFEEIRKRAYSERGFFVVNSDIDDFIAELKKKYTEGAK